MTTQIIINSGDLIALNLKNSKQIVFDVIDSSESSVLLAVSGLEQIIVSHWLPRSLIVIDSSEGESLFVCHLSPYARNDLSIITFIKNCLSLI